MKKHLYFLIVILLIAAILRLFKLNEIPISMSDDETRLVYSAYSIWTSGKDLSGNFLPLVFVVHGYAFNPVPIYMVSPLVGVFGLTMFTSRLAFALSGLLSVFVLYKITEQLLKNKTIALLASFCLTFSAWHLQLSRFAYEGTLALFFYLLGISLFLKIKKNSYIYLTGSMVSFLLAFYSYSGTKLIFLPLLISLLWYRYTNITKKQAATILALAIFTIFSFVLLGKFQGATQYGSAPFFFQDRAKAAEAVELERRGSNAPAMLAKLYHNKFTYWSKIFLDHYGYAISPQYLFLNQEGSGIFSVWFRGQLYYIEAPLLFLGLFNLFQRRRREFLLMMIFLLISPLPSALGTAPYTYTIRSSFMLPWLMLIVGSGIYAIAFFVRGKLLYALYALIIISYIYLIGGYLTQYYYEWMRYGANYYSKAAKDFIDFARENKEFKIIAANTGQMQLFHYAFYNQIIPEKVRDALRKDPIVIDNITFLPQCTQLTNETLIKVPSGTLYAVSAPCSSDLKKVSVIKTMDGNEITWRIYRGLKDEE